MGSPKTAAELSDEEREAYRRAHAARVRFERQALDRRRRRAWAVARRVAALLKDAYGATRVVVFGSLVHPGRFTAWSDVDLAVWGLDYRRYLRAVAFIHGLDEEVSVHLVDAATCSPALLCAAEREGVEL